MTKRDAEAIQAALAIIDKLETTADGIPVVPGEDLRSGRGGRQERR
jgi:hypothetical protein